MAYKVFSNGDALTGAELNTYLMNQSVIQFASTTARDAALPSPAEGQLVWLQDSNKYVYYTGSAWADLITPASSGNAIINGAFEINQRNFSSTSTGGDFTFDRFILNRGNASGTTTISSQTFTPGSAPVSGYEGNKYMQVVSAAQVATNDWSGFSQKVEDVRTLSGQTVTFSFWAKAATGTPKVALTFEQNFGSGGSSSVYTAPAAVTISTSWARYSITATLPSMSGKTIGTGSSLILYILNSTGSTLTALGFSDATLQNNTFSYWGLQLEAGSTATAFKRNGVNIEDELAACQRYYQRFNSINAYGLFGFGKAYNGNTLNLVFSLPVQMRTTPQLIETSAMSTIQFETGSTSGNTPTSITLNAFTSTPSIVGADLNKSGAFSTGAFYFVQAANSTSAYIAFGAEL